MGSSRDSLIIEPDTQVESELRCRAPLILNEGRNFNVVGTYIRGAYEVDGPQQSIIGTPYLDQPAPVGSLETHVRELRAEGVTLLALFLGNANRYALEILRSDPMFVVTEHLPAVSLDGSPVIGAIHDPLATGIASVMALPERSRWGVAVTAESVTTFVPQSAE